MAKINLFQAICSWRQSEFSLEQLIVSLACIRDAPTCEECSEGHLNILRYGFTLNAGVRPMTFSAVSSRLSGRPTPLRHRSLSADRRSGSSRAASVPLARHNEAAREFSSQPTLRVPWRFCRNSITGMTSSTLTTSYAAYSPA